jgi:hypothetical protein
MQKEPGAKTGLFHYRLWSFEWLALATLASGLRGLLGIVSEVARVVLLRTTLLLSALAWLLGLLTRLVLLATLLTALLSTLVLLCHCALLCVAALSGKRGGTDHVPKKNSQSI